MNISEAKSKLEEAEAKLATQPVVPLARIHTPHGPMHVNVTQRLREKCRKGRIWKSNAMLTALKNTSYGFDAKAPRSRSGADGIFRIDRTFRPANEMMRKLFATFIDKPDPLVHVISDILGTGPEAWVPVRVVSHHMRLLGVLSRIDGTDRLFLVDYDDSRDD